MLTTKVRILKQEFTRRDGYCPIEAVSSRVKTHDSIVAKAQRLCCPLTVDDIRTNILDIAGVRITCGRVSDTYRIAAELSALPNVTVTEVEDYIAKPKTKGDRSLHMILEIPVRSSNRVQQVPVEMQIRAIAQDLWASCELPTFYKYPRAIPGRLVMAVDGGEFSWTDDSSRLGQVTVATTQVRKVLGARLSPENRNATRFDSNSSQR
jgi:putative GTP pyrophosphokinase